MKYDKLTWEQLYLLTEKKLGSELKKEDRSLFKKWFMEREKVGYLFDYKLVGRAFIIWKQLKNNLDHFVVISGREGLGKSTLAFQLASWVNPNFTLDNVCYDAFSFVNILKNRSDKLTSRPSNYESIVLDEGTELLSRDAQKLTNKILVKTFFVQRALGCLVIINIPNFHMLDSVVRQHRVRTLIEVLSRGKYKAITGSGIQYVNKKGFATKDVRGVKIKASTFWHGYFTKCFPGSLSYDSYEHKKYLSINDLLTNLKKDLNPETKPIPLTKLIKTTGICGNTLRDMIHKGTLKARQIGSRWFVDPLVYEEFIKGRSVSPVS